MGCLQSRSGKPDVIHVTPRNEAADARSSNGFANGAKGTPKVKRSSKRYISPANSVENIDRLRNLPRPDSRRSRRSGQTPYPEPTMPPTPETEKRTMVVQYAEDLEPADTSSVTGTPTLGTRPREQFSRTTEMVQKPLSDGLYHVPKDYVATMADQVMSVEDLEADLEEHARFGEPRPLIDQESETVHKSSTDHLLPRRNQQSGPPDYKPPHHPAMSPRHKLEELVKQEKQDANQPQPKSPSANTRLGITVKVEKRVKHQDNSFVTTHTSELMYLDAIQQDDKDPETPKTPVTTPKTRVEYMFTPGSGQMESDSTPIQQYQPHAGTSSQDTHELYGDENIRTKKSEITYKSPRYLTPSPQNKFENKVAIEHFLGKQDPRSPRRLVLTQQNKSAFTNGASEQASMTIQEQNWTSPRDEKSEHSDTMEGFITQDSFECVDEVLDVENKYSKENNVQTFTSDVNDFRDVDTDRVPSPEKAPPLTHTFMPRNISEVKVKKERLKRKRKRSGRKASVDTTGGTPIEPITIKQYESDVYLQDISSVSEGVNSRQGSAASTRTMGSTISQGNIQSFIKPGFKPRPISGHSRASGQSSIGTPYQTDSIVHSTPNAKRLSTTNSPGKQDYQEGRLNFREISSATSSNRDKTISFPEINATTRYSYASGIASTSTRENSADLLSQASVDSLDISGSTAEFSHLPAKFQDTYQAVDDAPISPKRHYNVGPVPNDAMEFTGDSRGLYVEDFDVSAEQPSGSSSSLFSTKQKLLYSKYARSSRPKSDTTFGTGGRPPLPPARQRPHSDYTKPLHFSKYFSTDTDLL